MSQQKDFKLVVATFADDAGAARAWDAMVSGDGPGRIVHSAVVSKGPDGRILFHENAHTGIAEGAAEGAGIGVFVGLLGLFFTPLGLLGLPIGAAVGALVAKLRDSGFEDDDLRAIGRDLDAGYSALIATVHVADVEKAERLLGEANAVNVAVRGVDADLAAALDAHAAAAVDGPPIDVAGRSPQPR